MSGRKGAFSGEVVPGRGASLGSDYGGSASQKIVYHNPQVKPPGQQTSHSLKKDPFSTPARRRRIVAEISTFLLRQYCVKAVENVIRFRKWTAACQVIQRAWRCYAARKRRRALLLVKRTQASIILQCMVRCALSRRKLKRLRLADWTKRALKLAKALKAFWRARLLWRKKKRERALHRARMLKRKASAAMNIQRCFRGMLGRRLALLRRAMQSEQFRIRYLAAIKIQSCERRLRGYKLTALRRRRRRALWKVGCSGLLWFRRLQKRRQLAAIAIQRVARGLLARLVARKLRAEKLLRERQEAELRRLELQRLAAEEAATRRIELRLSVGSAIIRRIGALGPAEAVLWCLKHNVLSFWVSTETAEPTGYGLGPVPLQVVGAVESAFPSLVSSSSSQRRPKTSTGTGGSARDPSSRPQSSQSSQQSLLPGIVDVDADNKCIKLRKWDSEPAGGAGDGKEPCTLGIPKGPEQLPSQWKQVMRVKTGAEVTVDRGPWSIDLVVKITADAFTADPAAGNSASPIRWTVVTIVLEADCEKITNTSATVPFDLWSVDGPLALDESEAPDLKFKFKDTVVLLQPPLRAPLPPQSPPSPLLPQAQDDLGEPLALALAAKDSPVPSPRSPFDDSISDASLSPSNQQQQRVTVSIEPDWNAFARVIQRRARPWAQRRLLACRVIQKMARRRRVLRRWRIAVLAVLARAHRAATRIQTVVRGRLVGPRRVATLRLQVCSRLKASVQRAARRVVDDLSDYKFSSESEIACWAAFGVEADEARQILALEPVAEVVSAGAGAAAASAAAAVGVGAALPYPFPPQVRAAAMRAKLIRESMSFAQLPPSPWGATPPSVLLASNYRQDQSFGTVFAIPSAALGGGVGNGGGDTTDLPPGLRGLDVPELFLKVARSRSTVG